MTTALIIELDTLFIGGFALASEVLADRLAKYGISDTDPYRFVRKFYGHPLTQALKEMLPPEIDIAHVERRLAATYTALLQQNALQARDQLKTILRPILATTPLELAVVTHLRQDIISELFASITKQSILAINTPSPISLGISSETFQQAIVTLSQPTQACLALVACGESVRSAVRIGLRAVAIPDPMVAFENCAGADWVSDQMSKAFLNKLKARLK